MTLLLIPEECDCLSVFSGVSLSRSEDQDVEIKKMMRKREIKQKQYIPALNNKPIRLKRKHKFCFGVVQVHTTTPKTKTKPKKKSKKKKKKERKFQKKIIWL